MKFSALCIGLIFCVALCLALLPSCSGVNWSVSTPYGDASGDGRSVVVAPKPVVIPDK